MIWKTSVQCGSLSSYVLSSFTLNFALFKKNKSRIQAHPNRICNVYSTAVQSAQNKNIGFWLVKNILFPICSTHRTQSISPTNASTHHTQSSSAHFKWWILIGKKYIVSHLFDAPHPIDQVQPTQLFCWLWIGQRVLLWQPPTFLWTDGQNIVDFLKNLQR